MPHYTEMTLIQLSNKDYEAADACAGLRFRIATIAASVLFVHLTYRKWHKVLISSTNKLWDENVWYPLSQGTTQAELGGRMLHLLSVINSAGITRVIWWSYWSGGRFTSSRIEVKLDPLRQALSGGGSALLAVPTPTDVDTDETGAQLRRALGALGAITVQGRS